MTRLINAARAHLASKPSVTALVGPGPDSVDDPWDTWIFPNRNFATIENTQQALIVLGEDGGWADRNLHNTMKFPRMFVDVWADPSRNPDLSIHKWDAEDKIEAILDEVDKYFHLVAYAETVIKWDDMPIISSVRMDEAEYREVENGNGAMMARAYYAVAIA